MNIVVVLRAVQDPAGLVVNRRAQRVFVNREAYRLNPADANALEAALTAAGDAHTVSAVAYGGAPAEEVLRDALAKGAERALWVHDDALHSADAAVLISVLRRALEHLGGADLVALGAQVLDADLAQAAPRLAEALDAAFVDGALALRLTGSNTVQVVVGGAKGYRCLEAGTPVVAAVAVDSNRARYAPAGRIIAVYSQPDAVEAVTLADLGLDDAELQPMTERRGEAFAPEREFGAVMNGMMEETARGVAEELGRL